MYNLFKYKVENYSNYLQVRREECRVSNLLQTLFSIGRFSLRSYGVVVTLAIIIGFRVAYSLCSSEKISSASSGFGGLCRDWSRHRSTPLANLFYEWGYYSLHPAEILKIWHGGFNLGIFGWNFSGREGLHAEKTARFLENGGNCYV